MKCLFEFKGEVRGNYYEAQEHENIDLVGYYGGWDCLTNNFFAVTPQGKILTSLDALDHLSRELKFGNRDQIDSLKAWALYAAMPTEMMHY